MDNFADLNHNVDAFNAAVGAGFWDVVFAHPLLYIGYIFAFAGAIAFVIFFIGFLAGLPRIFTIDWHDEHQEHHRLRVTWGFFLMLYLFIAWELVRGVFGLFTNTF